MLQCITRLIIGGAQETVMLVADHLVHEHAFHGTYQVDVVSGPDTGPEGNLQEEVRARGIALTIVPELANPLLPHRDSVALWRLFRLMRERRYHIVHTNSTKAGLLGRIAARMARVPIVVHTVHGWGFHDHVCRGTSGLIALERWLARRTDRLITVTPLDIAKGLRSGIGRAEQYVTIRSGIELERFGRATVTLGEMRARLGIPPLAPVVGTVTRLSPQKAPLDFIRAARRIADHEPEARFVMVGDGPLRGDVERLITELGLAERVILTGLRRDVPELLTAFDLLVLTSLWEGLPRVLPQAMASGLPVVATAVDGNSEAVEAGVNGFLVAPGDVEQISARVLELLGDPVLMERMGKAGKQRAPLFGARRMVLDLDELYRELLHEQGILPAAFQSVAAASGDRRIHRTPSASRAAKG